LTVKVGDIWSGFEGLTDSGLSVAEAVAQQQGTPPAAAPTEKTDAKATPATSEANNIEDDPTLLTQAEIDLLQQLAQRREALDARESELELQGGLLKAAEQKIDKKVEEMKTFQATIKKLIKTYDEQQETKMKSLVKIYENMKPQDASRIFEELDMDTLLLVVERMKERKLAPVMAKMNPLKATEITVELAKLRNLPTSITNAAR
ncbi:MAG TPA: hypothetical protein ENI72_02925, partial [Rhodospirillales bacterium]|nr:hypothetical protein [Rhodospirillales bacterium]